jgi:hypothetical protein
MEDAGNEEEFKSPDQEAVFFHDIQGRLEQIF